MGPFTGTDEWTNSSTFALRNGPPNGNKRRMLFQVTYEKEGAEAKRLNRTLAKWLAGSQSRKHAMFKIRGLDLLGN
jgi:hypothetical protein